MSLATSRFLNVGGPSQSSARRAATSTVSGSSELAIASSIGWELHDLNVGVSAVPIASLQTARCRALTLGLLQPLIQQRVELAGSTGRELNDLDETHTDIPSSCERPPRASRQFLA